ncbi:MAG: PPC domain-containing protein, partial [Pirellulales bacterium]
MGKKASRIATAAACVLLIGAAPAVLLFGAAPVLAASPSLGSITPYGAQRGTEVEVNFNGGNLGDAEEILLYYPGISVSQFEAAGDGAVKTKLNIAADCRLGIHAMRVRTATGITNLRTFSVGALPEIQEIEPNSEFSAPQQISLDTTVNGVVENEDVDFFQVEGKKGERITAEIEGIRLGNTFFDPYVAILDRDRFELATCDDAALVWQDGVASIIAPEDGSYIVQVRESAFGGNGGCTYRLHVGRFPRPTATVPSGGRPGETVPVRWLGDLGGEWTEQATIPTERQPLFGLFARDDRGISPSPNA